MFFVIIARMKKENEENNDDIEFIESDEEGNPISKKDKEKKLRAELKECKKERDEYLTGWQRAKADYVNLQKELNETRVNSASLAKEQVIENILPVLDSFDMAMGNKEAWNSIDENWRKGIEYIYQQFVKSFNEMNVVKIDQVDVNFDPNIHEPIDTVITDKNELNDKVESIIQAGFKMGEKIIRPARVKIYKLEK